MPAPLLDVVPCEGRNRLDVRAVRFGANIDKQGIFVRMLR
jgi:hypothetical protein